MKKDGGRMKTEREMGVLTLSWRDTGREKCTSRGLVLSLSGQKEVCNYPDNNSNRGTICLLFAIQTIMVHSRPLYLPLIMIISLPLYWFHLADSLYLLWEMNLHFCFFHFCVLHQSKQI